MRLLAFNLGLMIFAQLQAASPVELQSLPAISNDTIGDSAPRAIPVDAMQLDFVITPGEYEPASLVLAATEDVNNLTFSVSGLMNAEGDFQDGVELDIRIVKRWYQKQFGGFSPKKLRNLTSELLVYDDELVRAVDGNNSLKLSDGNYVDISKVAKNRKSVTPSPADFQVRDAPELLPLSLKAGERRQFWFTLHVAPDVPAGIYSAAVTIGSGEAVFHSIPVSVEVLPFTLAEPVLEYSIYYRGVLDDNFPEGSISSEYKSREQMLADLKNMREHGITNPMVYQKLNTGLLKDVMELRQEAGFTTDKLYFIGINVVQNDNSYVRPSLAVEVKETLEIASQFGVEDVYFYARDEAKGEELTYQQPFWDAVKEAGGKIMATGWQDTINRPGNFSVTGGAEDLYVCLGTLEAEEAERWHSKDKLIYSYHNPPNSYEVPATYRRNYGLLLWQKGYDGAMPYAWQHSFGFAWNDFDHYRHRDNIASYPTVEGSIDTMQWEGFREGVDDVRYLSTLLEMLESDTYKDSPYYKPALDWVQQLRELPLGQADLDQVRAEMIGYILALRGWTENTDESPVVASTDVSPIEPDLTATLNWQTSLRTDARVEYGGKIYQSVPRMKNHVLQLEGISPGKKRSLEITDSVAGSEISLVTTLEVSADEDFAIENVTGEEANGSLRVGLKPSGDFRSSIAVVPDESLLGWWRFSGRGDTAKDVSGMDNTAELKGGAERVEGWFGRGVSLDGEGAFVHLPDIQVAENGTATVEGWFRFRSLPMEEVKNRGLFSGVYLHGNNNHIYFSRTNEACEIGSVLSLDTWHHIVVSWDGDASSATCYVDGEKFSVTVQKEAEEVQKINGLNIGRSSNYLGGLIGSATNTLDGVIDEIRVWNRVLSHDEVLASHNTGRKRLQLEISKGAAAKSGWKVVGANAADGQATATE